MEVGNASLDDDYAARHAEVTPGQYVMVAVTDTGHGIPADLLARVFEPFFTTKPEGQGTGLGLSMVYGFVKQSGGHVKIYSEPGHGTTVRMYLPRTGREEEAAAAPVLEMVGGAETILLVEDDDAVRATAAEMLIEMGYRVLKARSADSALAIVESGTPIDLLFTDVVMPGSLRSTELADRFMRQFPRGAVLFTSGYTQNAIVHAGRLDSGVELLSKPYSREALARKLRQVLDARRASAPQPQLDSDSRPHISSRNVLLLEDEVLIRITTVEMLEELSCVVTEAGSINEARMLFSRSKFDILLTDITLPDGSGLDFVREAREQNPDLIIVVASGQTIDSQTDLAGAKFVSKPYDTAMLAAAIGAASPHNR